MPPEDNSLPKVFITFTSLQEYEENKNKLSAKQIALVTIKPGIGKIFNNGKNFSGIIEDLEQIPQIRFLTQPGENPYLELYLRLYISEEIYRQMLIPVVSNAAAGLMTPQHATQIQTNKTDIATLKTKVATLEQDNATMKADIEDLKAKVQALIGG